MKGGEYGDGMEVKIPAHPVKLMEFDLFQEANSARKPPTSQAPLEQ